MDTPNSSESGLSEHELELVRKAFLSLPINIQKGNLLEIEEYWSGIATGSIILPSEVDVLNSRSFDFLIRDMMLGWQNMGSLGEENKS